MFVCGTCGKRYERGGFCADDGQPLAATSDAMLGTEIGRYRLVRMLGEGGMGQVYLGVQPAIGSRVAVKILSDQCARNPELLERFFAEAKAVNVIRHENIVGVLDLAQLPDGRPYIVMEFIPGQTLGALVRGGGAPVGGIVQVMQEVLSALGAAHQLGIVHRDLKPDNILVTAEGHAKVLDFGIAKLAPGVGNAHSPRTRTGALLGTPAYMAPEQISGAANVDARTDLYAAGVVLFEAVTGRVPFTGDTLYDLMRAHLEEVPPRPSALRPDLPAGIEEVVLTALAKAPADRFQTAAAMGQALHHASAELPPEQWRALSSKGGPMIAGPRSLDQKRTPVDPRAPTGVATPMPQPGPPTTPDATLSTRRRGRWLAVLAVVAAVGGVTAVVASQRGGGDPDPPARTETGSDPITGQDRTAPAPRGPVIVGGGSAADHGVRIGEDVAIGPNVVIGGGRPGPPAGGQKQQLTRPIDFDPRRFDAVAYLPKALALARTVFPDAGLAELETYYVFPTGLSDLTKSDDETTYDFRSPSHSARPTDVPRNVEVEINCYVEVSVSATEVEVRVRDLQPIDSNCKWPLHDLPRCSMAKVWAKARGDGAQTDTVAKIGFLHDGQWFFDNELDDEGITKSYADDCR